MSRDTKVSPSNHPPSLSPTTPAAPEPGRRGLGVSRRVAVAFAVLVLAILGLSGALVFTNLRISGRPDLSNKQVNAIASQQAGTAVSQLQSQPPAAVPAYQAVQAAFVVVQSNDRRLGHRRARQRGHRRLAGRHPDRAPRRAGASTIKVTFADGTTSPATIESSDPRTTTSPS